MAEALKAPSISVKKSSNFQALVEKQLKRSIPDSLSPNS